MLAHLTHPTRHDRMVELVERMAAGGSRLTACGRGESEIRIVERTADNVRSVAGLEAGGR